MRVLLLALASVLPCACLHADVVTNYSLDGKLMLVSQDVGWTSPGTPYYLEYTLTNKTTAETIVLDYFESIIVEVCSGCGFVALFAVDNWLPDTSPTYSLEPGRSVTMRTARINGFVNPPGPLYAWRTNTEGGNEALGIVIPLGQEGRPVERNDLGAAMVPEPSGLLLMGSLLTLLGAARAARRGNA